MTVSAPTRSASLLDLSGLLQDEQARKVDAIVPATKIKARDGQLIVSDVDPVLTDDGVTMVAGTYRPTEVFLEGVADKLQVPPQYLKRMHAQRPDLFDANVNGWLHGRRPMVRQNAGGVQGATEVIREAIDPDPRLFLFRGFQSSDEHEPVARAFLSNSYEIVDNLDVLTAILEGVKSSGVNVNVESCDLSDRNMRVRVVAPAVAALAPALLKGYRSPFSGASGDDNPTVFAGFVFGNSETGCGAWTITPRLVVQVCSNGMTMSRDVIRGVHLGGKKDEGLIRWTTDTQRKQLDLVRAKSRDVVATFLDRDYVEKVIAELTEKAGHKLTNASEQVTLVAKRLQFSEATTKTVLDHFIAGGQLTAGGVLQAVTSAAQTISDPDVAADVEAAGMKALELAASL